MTVATTTVDGDLYVHAGGLVAYVEERIRRRELLREKRIADDPPGLRDPDPGPLYAADILAALRKGLKEGEEEA